MGRKKQMPQALIVYVTLDFSSDIGISGRKVCWIPIKNFHQHGHLGYQSSRNEKVSYHSSMALQPFVGP
jgi:hypothetical protein